jgi:hypothetical protein
MGDEVRMKKLILASLCSVWVYASNEALISEYKKMFSRIGEKRVGADERSIEALQPVFVPIKKEIKKIESKTVNGVVKAVEPFILQAIFNEKAKIAGTWYEVGESIDGMKIVSIHNNAVWLKNSKSKKKLTIRKKNANISIK